MLNISIGVTAMIVISVNDHGDDPHYATPSSFQVAIQSPGSGNRPGASLLKYTPARPMIANVTNSRFP